MADDDAALGRELAANALEEAELERRLTEQLAQRRDARTAAFWAGGGNLLVSDQLTDDTLLHIASFLTTAKDLLRLGLTSTRFSTTCIAAPPSGSGGGLAAPAAPEMLPIPEEAARRWVAGCSEQERGWVPRRGLESWLALMQEVQALRLPLAFGRAHADITLSENGSLATTGEDEDIVWWIAASKVVMRSGCHFAQFALFQGDSMNFGVIRPGWGVEGEEGEPEADGHCFYDTTTGFCYPGNRNWEGMQRASGRDRIGMLLDLDQGSMTLYKNNEKMGVMRAEGLTGPLCWAISLEIEGDSARIESAPAPESPTEEELVAAKAWHAARYGADN